MAICETCSDIAVHGKTAQPHPGECWARIGEQVELEVEEAQAPVVR